MERRKKTKMMKTMKKRKRQMWLALALVWHREAQQKRQSLAHLRPRRLDLTVRLQAPLVRWMMEELYCWLMVLLARCLGYSTRETVRAREARELKQAYLLRLQFDLHLQINTTIR
jgi:hypothetical protein